MLKPAVIAWITLISVQFFALPATLFADEVLRLHQALDAVTIEHPAVKYGEVEFLPFIKRESELCQQRMSVQLQFSPPELSCNISFLLDPLQRQKLLILRRMLDISLADHRAGLENEALAIAFIDFDRTQTRLEQGQRSELDLSYFQSEYQPVRVRFYASERAQRQSRAMLALARGDASELISDIELPDFTDWLTLSAEEEQKKVIEAALQSNAVIKRLASLDEKSLLAVAREQLRFELLEILLAQEVMLIEKESADADFEYRSLYLDRARTLYELEVKADLGDSMVEQTSARQRQMEVQYQRVMLKATFNALAGKPLLDGLE